MRCRAIPALSWVGLVLMPALAFAQSTLQQDPQRASPLSRVWFVAGGGSTTMLGDCGDCENETDYLHTGTVMGAMGVSLNRRTDFGGEVLWVPATLRTGDGINVTFLLASVQFRPWQTRGFFLRTGLGMAFVKNWLSTIDESAPPLRSKAFGLDLGAGWEWRVANRLGVQLYGAQHAVALGDLETSVRTIENVMGNFWSVGAAIVVR